ncbi:MAG: chorismate mutase [Alphaproteobacteria bacterium]|jgi:chorismate mutase|nr:chorismate mutase [Alphaproteobacteria bacterium]
MVKKLLSLRKTISNIDKQIFKLLKKRSFVIPKVKMVKKSWDYKIAFNREVSQAKKIAATDFGLYDNIFMQKIWRELISATLYIEGGLRILIYKDFNLWELTKDHFSGGANLDLSEDIVFMLDELVNKRCECIVLPELSDSPINWQNLLNEPKYAKVKVNLKLPFFKDIKTFGDKQGLVLSLSPDVIIED